MTTQLEGAIPAPLSPTLVDQTFRAVLRRVYVWMAIGLSLTAIVAAFVTEDVALTGVFTAAALTALGLRKKAE